MNHIGKVLFGDLYWKSFNLTGPERRDAVSDRRQGKASNAVEEAAHRRRKLRIVPFRASTKRLSLHCAYSPHATRYAGLAWGPRCKVTHFATAWAMVRVVLTAAWAV